MFIRSLCIHCALNDSSWSNTYFNRLYSGTTCCSFEDTPCKTGSASQFETFLDLHLRYALLLCSHLFYAHTERALSSHPQVPCNFLHTYLNFLLTQQRDRLCKQHKLTPLELIHKSLLMKDDCKIHSDIASGKLCGTFCLGESVNKLITGNIKASSSVSMFASDFIGYFSNSAIKLLYIG